MSETIHVIDFKHPLGYSSVAATREGVRLVLLDGTKRESLVRIIDRDGLKLKLAGSGPATEPVKQIRQYLDGRRRTFRVKLDLRGTEFQLDVWRSLGLVGFGKTITYGELAERVGRPGAARAVGAACGANPVPIVIPCHRVLATGGKLGGFGGGLKMKRDLLALEGA